MWADATSIGVTLRAYISHAQATVLCAHPEGRYLEIAGMVMVELAASWANHHRKEARAHVLIVAPDSRRLGLGSALAQAAAAEDWARAHGAAGLAIGADVGPELAGIEALVGKRGYVPLEAWYRRTLESGG